MMSNAKHSNTNTPREQAKKNPEIDKSVTALRHVPRCAASTALKKTSPGAVGGVQARHYIM